MHRVFSGVIVLLFGLALAVMPAVGQEVQEPSDPLIIAQDHAWPPFSWLDDDGEPRGMLIDLWREIGREGGREVSFRLVDWPTSIELVRTGEADFHGGLFSSPQRSAFFRFSEPLLPLSAALFIGSDQRVISVDEMADRTIGVVAASFELEHMRGEYPDMVLREYRNNREMIAAALDGEIAAFVADYPVAMYLLDQQGAPARFHPLEVLYTRPLMAGMRRDDRDNAQWLADTLAGMDEQRIRAIAQRWLRAEQVEVLPVRLVLLIVAVAVAVLLGSLLLVLYRQKRLLNQAILQRTSELEAAREEQKGAYDFLTSVTSSLPGVIFSYRLEADERTHRFPFISNRVRDLVGVDPEDLAQDAEALFDRVHPEDVEHGRGSIMASARSLSLWRFRFRLRLVDGAYRWYESQSIPERQNDGSILWYGHFIDIHEQRLLEETVVYRTQFDHLVARVSSGLVGFDRGNLDPKIHSLLKQVGEFLQVDRCYLFSFSANSAPLSMSNTHEWCAEGVASLLEDMRSVPISQYSWWLAQMERLRSEGEILRISSLDDIPPDAVGERALLEGQGVAAMICVPVQRDEEVVGFFGVDSLVERVWPDDLTDQLTVIANLISQTLERHRLEQELIDLSVTDSLTGLYNRRYLMARLNERLAEYKRNATPLVVALLDIDHFKPINDTYGHRAGDEVLRRVSAVMMASVRNFDVVCRFGGEEFLLMFVDSDLDAGSQSTQRIVDVIRSERIEFEGQVLNVTASAGIASVVEMDSARVDAESLIECADHRLYRAKRLGRDQVIDQD